MFRAVDSPADEGRAVARLAAARGFPTVAVLAPRDDVGQEAADAFAAEARRLKLAVTAQGTYDPTGGNLEPDVRAFLNLVPAKNPRFAEHLARHGKRGWTTFSPEIPFSLLYVPDRHDRAALVAAFLPYYNVELRTTDFPDPAVLARKHRGTLPQLVQLVGGAGWNHPTLPLRGGAAVQGALIVDAFAGALGGDAGAAFAAAFQQRSGRAPTAAAAQVHDAATLDRAGPRRGRARPAAPPAIPGARCAPRSPAPARATAPAARPRWAPTASSQREPAVLEVSGDQLILVPDASPDPPSARDAPTPASTRRPSRVSSPAVSLSPRDVTIHLALFAASCATTWWAGGPAFAATLMGILVCHEAGHYVVGRLHGVPVSLPYFIPLPPQISLGTMGAVIRMDRPISDRNALFDVGAAGPIAGLLIAIPCSSSGSTCPISARPPPTA